MKKVAILALETAVPAAIVDPRYMFTAVNEFFVMAGQSPFFEVLIVGLNKEVRLLDGLMTLQTDALITDDFTADLIIIPAIGTDIPFALEQNSGFLPWIIHQHKKGAEVASLCIGAFILASTGLLEGKECSTHWLFTNVFKTMFPKVKLTSDRIITAQDGLYTSGGATSYWNLLLYLVEKYTNREMAITASKFFLLDIDNSSQLPFSIFRGQKNHGDEIVLAAQEYLEKQYDQKITIDTLVDRYAIGRRTFERRFKKATSNSVIEYMQRVKVEVAKRQLELGQKTVNEVMYHVGYSDTKAFRELFKKFAGLSPVDYMRKFNPIGS